MKRYGNKRDTVESDIVEALRKAGCSVYLTDKPFDLLIGRRGKTYLGECKDPKVKGHKSEFTPAQHKFMNEWRGGAVVVLRSSDDAIRWLNTQ